MSEPPREIRVLVVDDSPLFSEMISSVLRADPALSVVGVATDGRQAVEMAQKLEPDVITMDIQMPEMDGLEAIERIMASCPTPILVVTGDPRAQGDEMQFEALRRGALDVLAKDELMTPAVEQQERLREHIKFLAGITVVRHMGLHESQRGPAAVRSRPPSREWRPLEIASKKTPKREVLAIAASTGGPLALAALLGDLPPGFPAGIVVVQHIGRGFIHNLASWLDDVSALSVRIARDGEQLRPATVLLAPDDRHMTISSGGRISLAASEPVGGHRPSGTLLLASVARAYGRRAIGLVLTGMGRDGVEGLQAIREAGGVTLAQDEESSVVFGMPKAAIDLGAAEEVLSLAAIPERICRLVGLGPPASGSGKPAGR
jgi:two-component system chemotaxis response regulator CheB